MSNAQHTPAPAPQPYNELVEALRQGLNELPRFSFMMDSKGNVVRVTDPSGRWIDWQSAHELFDPEMVDALVAKLQARAALSKAKKGGAS